MGGTLEKLHSVTVALQSENLELQDFRILFDEIMNDNTENEFEKYLSTTSHLVDIPNFESAVRKILSGLENALSDDETASVSMLLRDLEIIPIPYETEASTSDFVTENLKKLRLVKASHNSVYLNPAFILATSPHCRKFF